MAEFKQKQNRKQSGYMALPGRRDGSILSPARAENTTLTQHQTLGNQAMQRFAKSCPLTLPSASICPFGGVCHTCPARVQTKLTIGQPGDKYEQEADRVAKQVIHMPDLETAEQVPIYSQSEEIHLHRACSKCEEELSGLLIDEEEHTLPSDTIPGHIPEAHAQPVTRLNTIRGNGLPIPESVRAFFEPRFGYDFSQVRLHTDVQAAETANAINARAFTIGSDIVFKRGEYNPDTVDGKKLLAHELTHVIQQGEGEAALDFKWSSTSSQTLSMTTPGDRFESEADIAEGVIMRRNSLRGRSFLNTSGKMIAGLWGVKCLSQKIGYWTAAGAIVVACGGAILTSATGIGLILLGAACVLAIIAYIAAIVSLLECMESDPDADRREIERLRQKQELMEERLRQVEEMIGRGEGTEGGGATE